MEPATIDPRAELAELGRTYRHVREAHERESAGGTTRRRIRREMDQIAEKFERLLEQWVHDDAGRAAWRAYLHHGADLPDGGSLAVPPLFRGLTEAGALLEIRAADDGGYDVLIDGDLVKHHAMPWHLDPEVLDPVQLGEWTCHETFSASDAAVSALASFIDAASAAPPWDHAPALLEDGLIDSSFALTPRGARRLGRGETEPHDQPARTHYCVLVANSARARILTLSKSLPSAEDTLDFLRLAADLTDPRRRARDEEWFTETRPGVRREGGQGPQHGVGDRRQNHRRESSRRFARLIADAAAPIWRQFPACRIVLVADPRMMGLLRSLIAEQIHDPTAYSVFELARDLTQLTVPALHDALAKAELLPPRERLAPVGPPMRTPNPWEERS